MKKLAVSLAAVFALVAVVRITDALAVNAPDTVTINGCKDKKAAVKMSHTVHKAKGVECAKCHHKGFSDAKVEKCSGCHATAQGSIGTCKEMSTTKNPFHKQCIGCHKTKAPAPTACNGCHK